MNDEPMVKVRVWKGAVVRAISNIPATVLADFKGDKIAVIHTVVVPGLDPLNRDEYFAPCPCSKCRDIARQLNNGRVS